jgi:hypothetical protein
MDDEMISSQLTTKRSKGVQAQHARFLQELSWDRGEGRRGSKMIMKDEI